MEDEVYEFINDSQVVFKDKNTVNVSYKGESKEIELSVRTGLILMPRSYDVLPESLKCDLNNYFTDNEDKEKAIYIAENCTVGDMMTQQLGIRFAE